MTRALAITRFVKDHLVLLDEFKTLQERVRNAGQKSRGLVVPVPTRWYSAHACMKNVLNGRDLLEDLFLSSTYASFRERYEGTAAARRKLDNLRAVVRDQTFWQSLRVVVRLMEPIIQALRVLESDKSCASSVYSAFRSLMRDEAYEGSTTTTTQDDTLPAADETTAESMNMPEVDASEGFGELQSIQLDELKAFFLSKIEKRWEYVHTNAMGIAFLLDPTTNNDDFVSGDRKYVQDATCQLALRHQFITEEQVRDLVAELYKYANQKSAGGQRARRELSRTDLCDYWAAEKDEFPLLGRIAEVVFAIPTSSSASERAWSIFHHINTKKRNHLSVQKVEKLVYIYINAGIVKGEQLDLTRHQSSPETIEE